MAAKTRQPRRGSKPKLHHAADQLEERLAAIKARQALAKELNEPAIEPRDECNVTRFPGWRRGFSSQKLVADAQLSLQSGDFSIRSRTRLSEDPWTVNAVGRILGKPLGHVPDALNIPNHSQGTPIEGEQHYQMAQAVGLQYEDAFRGVRKVWSDETRASNEVLSHVPSATSSSLYSAIRP